MKHENETDNFQKIFQTCLKYIFMSKRAILNPNIVTQLNLDSYPTNKNLVVKELLIERNHDWIHLLVSFTVPYLRLS